MAQEVKPKLETLRLRSGQARNSKLGLLVAALTAVLLAAAPAQAQLWLTYGEAAEFQGEPAVRFQIYHQHGTVLAWCVGHLYFTPTQVAYEVMGPGGYRQDSFAAARDSMQVQWRGLRAMKRSTGLFSPAMTGQSVEIKVLNGRKYDFFVARNIGSDGSSEFDSVSLWPLQNAWENFAEALERARTRYDPNRPPPPAPVVVAPKTASLQLEAQPGGAEFYIDDEFKGSTSGEGRIKVSDLAPGEHRLRLSKKDYEEWNRTLTLEAGESRTIEVQLAQAKPPEPPPPPETTLGLADVLKLLEGGVTPARVESIVKERGVSFELTDDAEKKLRALGATDSLLLAIAKAKK